MHLWTILRVVFLFYSTDAVTHLEIHPGLRCSYNYDIVVHTHRGERSTKELNFKINAKVRDSRNFQIRNYTNVLQICYMGNIALHFAHFPGFLLDTKNNLVSDYNFLLLKYEWF